MSNPLIKQIIAISASVFLLATAYYGSFRPLKKSQLFINSLQQSSNIRSVEDFEKSFSVPLDYKSPIGQEELVRNLGSTILNIIQTSGNNSPELSKELVRYLESYYEPIMDRNKGMSFSQNLFLLGTVNEIVLFQTTDVKYLQSSLDYFVAGNDVGPQRPQFLYGLFDIYRGTGNIPEAKRIGEQIISQWPDDQRIKDALILLNSGGAPGAIGQ
jgi:hypothetical protein